jgi:hypothetical protein
MTDFNEIEQNFDFDFEDFDFEVACELKTRYIKPPKQKNLNFNQINFKYASDLVDEINFKNLDRVFCRVSGKFIFGDFLEAFIVKNNILVEEMTIETLSLSAENIISLETLILKDYVQKLHIITSDYFYSHERNKLIKFAYEKLDIDNKFQLSVCRTHCKITQFKTNGGKHIVIHGSSNLRSSDNLEQFVIEDCKEMYYFNNDYHKKIEQKFKTINYGK